MVKFTRYLHLGNPQAQVVPLDGIPSHQSKLHASLITGQGCMENKTWQKSVASASGCIGLTTLGHVSQSRKQNKHTTTTNPLYVKITFLMPHCLTWQRVRFSCRVEHLTVKILILNVSNRLTNSNYSELNVSQENASNRGTL